MTPQQWIEGISAGSTIVLIALAAGFAYLRKVIKGWRELMTEIKRQATAAASSAANVDDSMHKTNSGQNVKDVLVRIERDLGGIKHTLRTLADADVQLHQRVADLERGPKGVADRS